MSESVINNKPKGFGIRHLQATLCFFCLTFALTLRVNMSVAIVAMTRHGTNDNFQIFPWDETIQGMILSSFFWGYIITMIPAGILTHKFGAKRLLLIAVLGASMFTVFIPLIAPLGWKYVCAFRVVNGLFQGFIFPCIYNLMSKWIHPSERRISTIINAGAQFGVFLILIISGSIASSSIGWPGIFYISSSFGFFWSLLWFILGVDSPSESKTISSEEKQFLVESVGTSTNQTLDIPWKKVIVSIPFIILVITHCSHNWGYYILMTEIPTYMNDILNFEIKSNSFMSSLPYLVMFLLSLVMSPIADLLINRRYITVAVARKLFNSIGMWLPMISLIGLSFVGPENSTLSVILLMFAVGFNAGTNAGFMNNYIDLSPNFASTIFSVSNFFANIISIIGPLFVGFIVTDAENISLWRIVFYVSAVIYFIGNLLFLIFGKGSIQSWNGGKAAIRKVNE